MQYPCSYSKDGLSSMRATITLHLTLQATSPAERKKAAPKKGKKGATAPDEVNDQAEEAVVGAGSLDLASPLPNDSAVATRPSPSSALGLVAAPQAGAKKALHKAFDVSGSAAGKNGVLRAGVGW